MTQNGFAAVVLIPKLRKFEAKKSYLLGQLVFWVVLQLAWTAIAIANAVLCLVHSSLANEFTTNHRHVAGDCRYTQRQRNCSWLSPSGSGGWVGSTGHVPGIPRQQSLGCLVSASACPEDAHAEALSDSTICTWIAWLLNLSVLILVFMTWRSHRQGHTSSARDTATLAPDFASPVSSKPEETHVEHV